MLLISFVFSSPFSSSTRFYLMGNFLQPIWKCNLWETGPGGVWLWVPKRQWDHHLALFPLTTPGCLIPFLFPHCDLWASLLISCLELVSDYLILVPFIWCVLLQQCTRSFPPKVDTETPQCQAWQWGEHKTKTQHCDQERCDPAPAWASHQCLHPHSTQPSMRI